MSFELVVKEDQYTTVEGVQIILPNRTYNLLSASAIVRFISGSTLHTFAPIDNLILGDLGPVSETMDPKAPSWDFNLHPQNPTTLAELVNPAIQGSVVRYWSFLIDEVTGDVLFSRLNWKGKINTQNAVIDASNTRVEVETVTPNDMFMVNNEGERLNVAWQDLHFPGQKGLEFNDEAALQPYWGIDVKNNPTRTGSFSGYAGTITGGLL